MKLRPIAAGVFGILAACALILILETASRAIHPPPAGFDSSDLDQVRRYVAGMPDAQLQFALGAYAIATLTGGVLASIIARTRPYLQAGAVGGVLLAMTIVNFALITHPSWFVVSAIVAILLAALAAGAIGARAGRRG